MDKQRIAAELVRLAEELVGGASRQAAGRRRFKKPSAKIKKRLEYLREQIENENISYGEIAELEDLAEYIDDDDVQLLEWAGVPERSASKRQGGASRQAAEAKVPVSLAVKVAKDHLKKHGIAARAVTKAEIEAVTGSIDLVLTFDDDGDDSYLSIELQAGPDSYIE